MMTQRNVTAIGAGASKAFRERFDIPNEDDVFSDVDSRIQNQSHMVQALKARVLRSR